jgi:hypothetical protein
MINDQMKVRLPTWHLLRLVGFFPVPFAIREYASAGEVSAFVVGQTWLCHHFFPTQFPPS